jgi:hypothetical protein
MTNPRGLNGVRFVGYVEMAGLDREECLDYIRHIQRMPRGELEMQLRLGTLPPGVVVLADGLYPGVVEGRGEDQGIRPLRRCEGVRI